MSKKQLFSVLPALAVLIGMVLGCVSADEPRPRPRKDRTSNSEVGQKPTPSPNQEESRVAESPSPTPSDVRSDADTPRPENVIVGKVVGVSDGDTITVLDAERSSWKIRLATIDSPEKNQDFGARAKESLSGMVFGREVEVEVRTVDRYGRNVGVVRIGGMDVNLEQIKRGFAWHYTQYSKEQPFEEKRIYAQAQDDARARRVGLWSQENPIEPWSFRRGMRRGGSSAE